MTGFELLQSSREQFVVSTNHNDTVSAGEKLQQALVSNEISSKIAEEYFKQQAIAMYEELQSDQEIILPNLPTENEELTTLLLLAITTNQPGVLRLLSYHCAQSNIDRHKLSTKLRESTSPTVVSLINSILNYAKRDLEIATTKITYKSKPLEIKSAETISLNVSLPKEYSDVLEQIPESIPVEYRKKMEEAAYYFWALETGQELFDENGFSLQEKVLRMANQIADSTFALSAYTPFFREPGYDPDSVLPDWVVSRKNETDAKLAHALSQEELDRIDLTYQEYLQQNANNVTKETNGIYARFTKGTPPRSEKTIGLSGQFKCYIENDSLLPISNVIEALDTLTENGYHPHSCKLFEGTRLVLYWDSNLTEELEKEIRNIFEKTQVEARGMAQDPTKIIFDEDGSFTTEVFTSNDGSLGDGGHNRYIWESEKYDKQAFFHQYLRLVTNGAKDPTEPYKIGYVLIDKSSYDDLSEFQEQAKTLASIVKEQDNLPVIISERGRIHLP